MKTKKFGERLLVRLDKGEEIVASIKQICKENNIVLGSIIGLGATNKVKIGLFETGKKKYHSTELTGDYEIAHLYGNISTMNGEIYLHIHINLCDAEHKSFGGHLDYAYVSATFEAFINPVDGRAEREFSQEIGLNLLKL